MESCSRGIGRAGKVKEFHYMQERVTVKGYVCL